GLKARTPAPKGISHTVRVLAFAPDGRTLASNGPLKGQVQLWDTASGKEVGSLRGNVASVSSLAFSRDGKSLVSGDARGEPVVVVWDLAARRPRVHLNSHDGPVL